ncbi:MAG: tetratricopeptide repeat protein [Planctomycetota bacterium]
MASAGTSLPAARAPKAGCDASVRPSKRSRWRVIVLVAVHLIAFAHILHWKLKGTSISPMEPSEAFETLAYGFVNAGFVLLALAVVSTLLLGRFFCGWACHVVALQDLCAWMLGKVGLRPRPIRSRLLVWVPVLAAVDIYLLPMLARWVQISFFPPAIRFPESPAFPGFSEHLTTNALWETFPGPWMALLTFFVDGFLIVYLLGAKGFCTYGCPYGALFGAVDRVAKGRIRVTDACEGCGHCTATCTSNVDVRREVAQYAMVVDAGCMKCLDCVSVCPKDALYFGFGPTPARAPKRPKSKPKKSYDFSWGEELVMAAVFLFGLHAFRGLYGAVPFLLSIGLAVIAAVGTIVAWRLLSRAELTFQHHLLKRSTKLTGAGFGAVGALLLFLAFTAHSGFVQTHQRLGDHNLRMASTLPRPSAERTRAVAASLGHFRYVDRIGLRDTPELHNKLGQLLIDAGKNAEAEPHLRRAVELDDSIVSARMRLAEVLIVGTRYPEATEVLGEVLARQPLNSDAGRRLAMIVERAPGAVEPRLMLIDLLIRMGNLEGARNGLLPLQGLAAGDARVQQRLDDLEAARAAAAGEERP